MLPSEVDISGAGKERTIGIKKKRLRNYEITTISKSGKIFVTFCSGDLWSWKKRTVVINQKRLLFKIKQKTMIVLRYLLPSVVEIVGAGKRHSCHPSEKITT